MYIGLDQNGNLKRPVFGSAYPDGPECNFYLGEGGSDEIPEYVGLATLICNVNVKREDLGVVKHWTREEWNAAVEEVNRQRRAGR